MVVSRWVDVDGCQCKRHAIGAQGGRRGMTHQHGRSAHYGGAFSLAHCVATGPNTLAPLLL